MRRFVHYYPYALDDSGVTFALWGWARAQAAAGYEVAILHGPDGARRSGPEFVAKPTNGTLTTQQVPHRGRHRLTTHAVGLDRFLGRNDLLILHEGWVPSNIAAASAAQRAGVPYVVMPHGVYDPAWTPELMPPRWLRYRLERRVLERAAAVHVFFESEIPDIEHVAPGASFLTAPTGFDVPMARWTGTERYLAWLGRVDPFHKGLDLLVGAMARLRPAERPQLRIHGYDYKGGLPRLQRIVAERGLERWVHFGGVIAGEEKLRFLQRAAGYVHPSRWECHSIALLENLALGVPCMVSSVIHIAPELERAHAAMLASPSEEALATALPRFINHANGIGERARAHIAANFAWSAVMPRYVAELERLGLT